MLFRALLLISLCAECVVPLGFSLAKARRQDLHRQSASALDKRDVDPSKLYPERNFSMPIDHFKNDSTYAPHSNKRFNVRYWFDASHYKAGGPVFILQGGETDASSRLPFLQKGIVNKVIEATNGLGVVSHVHLKSRSNDQSISPTIVTSGRHGRSPTHVVGCATNR